VFKKGILEPALFVVGVLVVSAILGWLTWNTLGLLVADSPDVVKLKH
jgi:hypothetical protein